MTETFKKFLIQLLAILSNGESLKLRAYMENLK